MTTSIDFAIHSDDEEIRELVKDMDVHSADFWRVAVFMCQQQLEKALARDAVRKHYDNIQIRARATREAKRDKSHD